jgi:hypothetical protein
MLTAPRNGDVLRNYEASNDGDILTKLLVIQVL